MTDTAAPDTTDPAPVDQDQAAAADPADDGLRRKTRRELADEVRALRSEVARLRAGEEPVAPNDPISTGGHLLWVLGHSGADMRQRLAGLLVRSLAASSACLEGDHVTRITLLERGTATRQRTLDLVTEETARLDRTSGPEGRAVAMAVRYALLTQAN
ncbi:MULTISPECIES: hypothetical protein [unclassified Streptomyces]|uniref:hypothetical protein n=1 Tax=unclassified Streptomyces TaxID=2593676 RepID=UPI00331B5BE3